MTPVVQKLAAFQRAGLLEHLLGLAAEDRRLRFGMLMQDEAIAGYVDKIDFSSDKVFGIVGLDLRLIGAAHLALHREAGCAELGLSVNASARGKGHGFALLQRAGLKVVVEQGGVDARLRLEATSFGGVAREAVEDQLALIDLFWKRQLQWWPAPVRAA